jgi:dTDP-4-amino-4,6-dideoxygalactose transaminase
MPKASVEFPVMRPQLPTVDQVLPYLKTMDAARWYANHGPLVRQFETRLADHFAVEPSRLVTASNATLAIALSLRALGVPAGSLCVMPSWTFVATAAAVVWAGLEPYFIDVDPGTWLITPEDVLKVAARRPVGAVIVVSAFGAPLDLKRWDTFARDSGIPVVVDAAAGFDSFRSRDGYQAAAPVVVSLHATKVFGVGEGAVVLTGEPALANSIRAYSNFGFQGSRNAEVQGVNAKMPEYAAATGLAQLDRWTETRLCWDDLTTAFVEEVKARPQLGLAPDFGEGWVSCYGLVELPPAVSASDAIDVLARYGVEARKWWGDGCHRHTAYEDFDRSALPNTDYLGRQVLGLPFWQGLSRTAIHLIFQALDDALDDIMAAGRGGATKPRTRLRSADASL